AIDLEIGQLGRLTIRSQHVDDAAKAIGEVEARVRTLLAAIGADSLELARQRQNAARDKSNALTLDRQLLGQLAPDGVETLRETVARLDALRGDGIEIKFDAAAITASLGAAEARVV